MKRQYECMYIIANNIAEEKRTEIITKFQKMAGADTKVEKLGNKKFATPIDYRKDGFYVLMTFNAEPEVIKEMVDLMNITEGVVRHLFTSKENLKIEKGRKKEKKEKKESAV